MHLDDERIERLVVGELALAADAELARHLSECGECRARLDAARREDAEVRALLAAVDHPVPRVDARTLIVAERGSTRAWRRWAAAAVLALGLTGGAYAASAPLGRLLERALGSEDDAEVAPPSPPAPAPLPSPPTPSGGIAVDATAPVLVVLRALPTGASASVTLGDEATLSVEVFGGEPAFAAEGQRLEIVGDAASTLFVIRIPRAAPRVEVRVGDRAVFLKEGAATATDAPGDASAGWTISLDP
jgi:hypothetical protein